MTGKELKEWASTVHDSAVILVKERSSYRFDENFTLQASLVLEWPAKKEEDLTKKEEVLSRANL